MRWVSLIVLGGFFIFAQGQVGGARPTLTNGVISYFGPGGERESIRVRESCADLWVSSDDSVIAFITIDRKEAPSPTDYGEQLIEKSSIYTAYRANHFAPVRVVSRSFSVEGSSWPVLRDPRVSPSLKTLYFSVPYTETTSKIMSVSLVDGSYKEIGDASDYCVIWGGGHAGYLITQRRYIPADPSKGVTYQCYLRDRSGEESRLTEECSQFRAFAAEWSRARGGSCY